jgi:hypothetical protein
MVIAAVGDDEQGALGILRLIHFVDAKVNGVEQGSAPLGNREHQLALDVFHGLREIGDFFGSIREGDHEELVLRVRGLEEFLDGLARFIDFAAHAAADVENDTDGDWGILAGEILDLLRVVALEDGKILAVKTGDESVQRIGNGDGH